MSDLVERAKALACRAHSGQVDKAGRPYIEHVARVAAAVRRDGRCSEPRCDEGELLHWHDGIRCPVCDQAEAVAWLHDCMEDAPWTEEKIRCNFPSSVSLAVAALTRWRGHSAEWYYDHVRNNPLALRVKLADIADNSDEARLALLDDKTAARLRRKYAKARQMLEAA